MHCKINNIVTIGSFACSRNFSLFFLNVRGANACKFYFVIYAIAGIIFKSELCNFFRARFYCLLKNSDILFGSDHKREI